MLVTQWTYISSDSFSMRCCRCMQGVQHEGGERRVHMDLGFKKGMEVNLNVKQEKKCVEKWLWMIIIENVKLDDKNGLVLCSYRLFY